MTKRLGNGSPVHCKFVQVIEGRRFRSIRIGGGPDKNLSEFHFQLFIGIELLYIVEHGGHFGGHIAGVASVVCVHAIIALEVHFYSLATCGLYGFLTTG